MTEKSAEWMAGYDVGYEEGGNSVSADWLMALDEWIDWPDGVEIDGPMSAVAAIKALLATRTETQA